MSWQPPEWMNREDIAAEQRAVEAFRGVVMDLRKLAEQATTEIELLGWRWRLRTLTREAEDMRHRLHAPVARLERIRARELEGVTAESFGPTDPNDDPLKRPPRTGDMEPTA